jgi:hypothetical protein
MRKLKEFSDGDWLCYDRGSFDNYHVAIYDGEGKKHPLLGSKLRDVDFLDFFVSISKQPELVYKKIVYFSEQINSETRIEDFKHLDIPTVHGTLIEDKFFSAYAAAMLAEEKKAWTKLGKRIKLLAANQVLLQGMSPQEAANWGKGRSWQEISEEADRLNIPQRKVTGDAVHVNSGLEASPA